MSNNKSLHSQGVEEEFQIKQFYLIVILFHSKRFFEKMCKTLPPPSHVIDCFIKQTGISLKNTLQEKIKDVIKLLTLPKNKKLN